MKQFENNVVIVPRIKYFNEKNESEVLESLKLAKWLLSFQTCIGLEMIIDGDEFNYDEDYQLYWLVHLIDSNPTMVIFGANNKQFREKYFHQRAFKIFIRKDWEHKNNLAKAIYESIQQINLADEEASDLYYLMTIYETLRKYSLYEN